VIICDDGSIDNTRNVAESFKNRLNINYIWEENWGGPARPRNNGIREAQGEWICFLDSDDWWYPTKLEVCLKYVDEYDVIYHDMDKYSNNGRCIWGKSKGFELSSKPFEDLILFGNALPNSTVVIRKSIINLVGPISEDVNLLFVEDYDYWIKVSQITSKFRYIPESLAAYWKNSLTNNSANIKQIERFDYLFNKNLESLSITIRERAKKRHFYRIGRMLQTRNKKVEALNYFMISIKSKDYDIKLKSLFRFFEIKLLL